MVSFFRIHSFEDKLLDSPYPFSLLNLNDSSVEFFRKLFQSDIFMPHGHCYLWKPEVLWTNLMGDALTAFSYFVIPFVLIYFNRKRRESVIAPVLWLFGAFIFFCGTSHIIDIITIWVPSYRFEALIKIITGVVSLITAIYLIRILPAALRIPSPMQLEEANIELNKFAYTVAHDLRSPMRQIMGYARLLESKEDQSLTPKGRVYLQNIVSISKDIGGMVDELLEYTKTQKSESVRVNINTQVLVEKLIEELELSTDQDMDWQVGNLPDIKADEVMVKAVFRNLLENALKYSRNKAKSIIILTGKKVGNKVHFKLRDNGVGFDMAYYHKLFQPFERLHSSEEFEGHGIGLAHVSHIIQKHGGKIDAYGELDEGAMFKFDLPAS